jgi:hypothetical protein
VGEDSDDTFSEIEAGNPGLSGYKRLITEFLWEIWFEALWLDYSRKNEISPKYMEYISTIT